MFPITINSAPLLLLLLFFTASSASTIFPRSHPSYPPKSWFVSHLTSFQPSGRPGSSRWSIINATITDPNIAYDSDRHPPPLQPRGPSTAICAIKFAYDADPPYGRVTSCLTDNNSTTRGDAGLKDDRWTVTLLEPPGAEDPSPLTDFVLKFTRRIQASVQGAATPFDHASKTEKYVIVLEGSARFQAGDNTEGVCGGSGVCSFGLKEGKTPVYINQTRAE